MTIQVALTNLVDGWMQSFTVGEPSKSKVAFGPKRLSGGFRPFGEVGCLELTAPKRPFASEPGHRLAAVDVLRGEPSEVPLVLQLIEALLGIGPITVELPGWCRCRTQCRWPRTAGVPRYAELVTFADDSDEAALNQLLLRTMGYTDLTVWLHGARTCDAARRLASAVTTATGFVRRWR